MMSFESKFGWTLFVTYYMTIETYITHRHCYGIPHVPYINFTKLKKQCVKEIKR